MIKKQIKSSKTIHHLIKSLCGERKVKENNNLSNQEQKEILTDNEDKNEEEEKNEENDLSEPNENEISDSDDELSARTIGDPLNIEENYQELFGKNPANEEKKQIMLNLLDCINVRMFGITFAPKTKNKNISITGPIQISYGINRFPENVAYSNQILSPFAPSKKGATTIGSESKALEIHYVYDFVINPKTIDDVLKYITKPDANKYLQIKDIEKFKEGACRGVNHVNSTTKIGSENEFFLYIEFNQPYFVQNLGYLISIIRDEDSKKINVDLTKLYEYLFDQNIGVLNPKENEKVKIEIYYNPQKTIITGFKVNEYIDYHEFEILKMKELSSE